MLYIIALILLAALIAMTCLIGFTTNQQDTTITIQDAQNKIGNIHS